MEIHTTYRMPMGKHRGKRVDELSTTFMSWFISQDACRFKYPETALALIAELRRRFLPEGAVEAELVPGPAQDGNASAGASAPDDYSDLL